MAYTGPVYFGTPIQGNEDSDFVYDTGSGYLVTTSSDCDLCDSQYFDPSLSTSGSVVSSSPKILRYGSATVFGTIVNDRVCLEHDEPLDMCAESFEFLVMTKSKGLNGNDGILGLSPPDKANRPSYIQALYNQGNIDDEVATFWINDEDIQSTVVIGGVPDDAIVGKTYTHDLIQRYKSWWTVNLCGLYYGDNSIKQSRIRYAILDTGTSLMYFGRSDYEVFKTHMMKIAPEIDCSGIYCKSTKYTCDHYLPLMNDITIVLGNTYYTITPDGYTFSGDNKKKFKCTVAISYNDDHQGLFILGDTFLRNFVSTFNFKESTIQLGVNINAPKNTLIEWKMSMP